MEQRLIDSLNDLKSSIEKDKRYILLLEKEKIMESDKAAIEAAIKKDKLADEYSSLLKIYKDDDEIVIKKRKELSEAKEEFFLIPSVTQYQKAYSDLKEVLDKVNHLLFDDFKMEARKHD